MDNIISECDGAVVIYDVTNRIVNNVKNIKKMKTYTKKEYLPCNVRSVIYSFLELTEIVSILANLSKKDRMKI